MIIGALRLTFIVPPDGGSTYGTAQKIKDRLWSKFKLALSEQPSINGPQLVIGAALVGYDEAKTRARLDQVVKHLNEWSSVELINDEVELVHFDDIEMERDFEKYDP